METERHVVLVVEDEVLIRLAVIATIEDAGFEALSAVNADQALEVLAERPDVKVVFTDVNMPGSMDGLTLANFVMAKWPRITLFVTSGKLSPTILYGMPAGGQFFSKPYVLSDLIKAIRDTS